MFGYYTTYATTTITFVHLSGSSCLLEMSIIQFVIECTLYNFAAPSIMMGILVIIASTFLIYTGNIITGSILGGGTLASLVYTFVYGTRNQKGKQQEQSTPPANSSDTPSLTES